MLFIHRMNRNNSWYRKWNIAGISPFSRAFKYSLSLSFNNWSTCSKTMPMSCWIELCCIDYKQRWKTHKWTLPSPWNITKHFITLMNASSNIKYRFKHDIFCQLTSKNNFINWEKMEQTGGRVVCQIWHNAQAQWSYRWSWIAKAYSPWRHKSSFVLRTLISHSNAYFSWKTLLRKTIG